MASNAVGEEVVEDITNEKLYVYQHVALRGVQTTALIAPPVTFARMMYKGNFTINRWLRKSAAWTFVAGSTSGLTFAWTVLRNQPDIAMYDRAYRLRHNASQVKVDDYSKVGAILGALLTTTIFLKRAPLVTNLAGGAALGVGGGVITHFVQMVTGKGAEQAAKESKEALPDPVELGKTAAK